MIAAGYECKQTLERRIEKMEEWLKNPQLLAADEDAEYAAIIDININEIKEPLLACPNDPDDVRPLSEVAGTEIDEVFIGSCMTNIGHYRAAGQLLGGRKDLPVRLWMGPPTKMDAQQLHDEGYYSIFGVAGARIEIPGCSLCMGNQAQVHEGSTVVSTSTRNFPNRLGKNTKVFLASAELSAVTALLGHIPDLQEYQGYINQIQEHSDDIYRYLNFDKMPSYEAIAEKISVLPHS